jgi:DNA-binding PadR family transcriptional regulator
MLHWEKDVEPVLRTTYELLSSAEEGYISGLSVNAALGRDPNDERIGDVLEQLHKAGYIEGKFVMNTSVPIFIRPTEKGLQQTQGWPEPGGAAADARLLLKLLDERIGDADTPEEERTRLQKLRASAGEVGESVLGQVMAAYLKHYIGV